MRLHVYTTVYTRSTIRTPAALRSWICGRSSRLSDHYRVRVIGIRCAFTGVVVHRREFAVRVAAASETCMSPRRSCSMRPGRAGLYISGFGRTSNFLADVAFNLARDPLAEA